MVQAYAEAQTIETKSALWLLRISSIESGIGCNGGRQGRLN
jgi:hypothetical protein